MARRRITSALVLTLILVAANSCGKAVSKTGSEPVSLTNHLKAADAACPGAIGDAHLTGKPALTIGHGQVVTAAAGTLTYTVTSGYQPIYAVGTQSGPVRACLFFFAYSRDDHAGDAKWPVTFLFNGGPGSASDWLHLGGMGPKKMDFGPEGITAGAATLGDDQFTLLANSDLVFIDPINTGYSRPAQGVDPAAFDGLDQDAQSIGDFIEGYLTSFARLASPKYILGESYGGMRLPVLSRYLDEKLGIKLQGITFISPWLDAGGDTVFGQHDLANDLPYVGYLPEYATIAWYHHKLGADLEAKDLETIFTEAESFANGDYLDALALGDDLPAATRATMTATLSRYTGLSATVFDANNLRLSKELFRSQILQSTGEVVAYYDGRMKAVVSDPVEHDPYDAFDPLFTAADTQYFGGVLGITTDLNYTGNNWSSWPGATSASNIAGGYLNVLDDLNTLMKNNPQLKVYMANGLFDLVCPAAEDHFMIRHLDPAAAARIQIGHYPAGHPIYFGDISHEKFSLEIAPMYGAGKPLP